MTATAEERIEFALDRPMDIEVAETPLAEVAEYIAKKANVDVVICRRAIEDEGLSDTIPVTAKLKGMTLRRALEWTLRDIDLTFIVRHEAIEITTTSDAQSAFATKAYPVREIAALPDDPELLDRDSLIEALTAIVAPNTWEDSGGAGAIGPLGDMLIVTQSEAAQREVAAFLAACKTLKGKYAEAGDAPVVEPIGLATAAASKKLLARVETERLDVDFAELPLDEAVAYLSEKTGISIAIDKHVFVDSGLGTDLPVSLKVTDALLSNVLARILRDLELTWVCVDELVVITTPEAAALRPTIVLYPIRDLAAVDGSRNSPAQALRQSLPSFVAGEKWTDYGGNGSIVALPALEAIVVAQSDDVHVKIEEFLASLRQAKVAAPPTVAEASELEIKVYRPLWIEANAETAGELMAIVRQFVEPQSWSEQGRIESLGGALVVRQTADAHRQMRQLFRTLQLPVTTDGAFMATPLGVAGGGGSGGVGGGGGMGGGGGFFNAHDASKNDAN